MSVTTLERMGTDLNAIVKGVGRSGRKAIGRQVQMLPIRFEQAALGFYPKVLKAPTGRLKGSIMGVSRREGSNAWAIGLSSDVEYAAIQEYGGYIPPHAIEAKGKAAGGADALHWKGARHPVRRVHHPGGYIKAKLFLRHPMRVETEKALAQIRKEVKFK